MWRPCLVITLVSWACSDIRLEIPDEEVTVPQFDNELSITGQFCTSPAADVEYPVKVMFIVDGSGSQQFSDQNRQRVVAVEETINALIGAGSTYFKVVVFNASVTATPAVDACTDVFTRSLPELQNALANLGEADSLTDYQGALNVAYHELQRDMQDVSLGKPEHCGNTGEPSTTELARTKYVVIFVSDGMPDPQCTIGLGNDVNPQDGQPDQICESTAFLNCLLKRAGTVCSAADYGTCSGGAVGCAYNDATPYCCDQQGLEQELFGNLVGSELEAGNDYNQPYQILQKIDDIMTLAERYQVGELRVHAGLVLDPLADPAIIGLFGDPAQAIPLMKQIAAAGDGQYLEFYGGDSIDFLQLDYEAIKQHRVLRGFFVDNRAAQLTARGLLADTDFDGLSDEEEFSLGTDATRPDTDNDGYSDLLELRLRGFAFEPLDPCLPPIDDSSGSYRTRSEVCDPDGDGIPNIWDPAYPVLAPCQGARTVVQYCIPGDGRCDGDFLDTDRDGLHDCEETALGTDKKHPDSDGDGIPDLLELVYGMDATRWDSDADSDKDTIPDGQELEWHLHPRVQQTEAQTRDRYRYKRSEISRTVDGRTCYSFSSHRIQLTFTQPSASLFGWRNNTVSPIQGAGYNEIRLYILENTADNLSAAPLVRSACVRPQYIPPSRKVPALGTVELTEDNFKYLGNTEAQFSGNAIMLNSPRDCLLLQ